MVAAVAEEQGGLKMEDCFGQKNATLGGQLVVPQIAGIRVYHFLEVSMLSKPEY